MSDGKVRIIVDLDGQKAEAEVKSLKSMLEGITSSGNKTGSMFKSILGANIVSGALTSSHPTWVRGLKLLIVNW